MRCDGERAHQIFPAPGVYEGETTLALHVIVVQLINPSKVATGACTFSAGAVISTLAFAWIAICPPALKVIEQPLE
jgi:hypothetical protein